MSAGDRNAMGDRVGSDSNTHQHHQSNPIGPIDPCLLIQQQTRAKPATWELRRPVWMNTSAASTRTDGKRLSLLSMTMPASFLPKAPIGARRLSRKHAGELSPQSPTIATRSQTRPGVSLARIGRAALTRSRGRVGSTALPPAEEGAEPPSSAGPRQAGRSYTNILARTQKREARFDLVLSRYAVFRSGQSSSQCWSKTGTMPAYLGVRKESRYSRERTGSLK